MSDDIKKSEQPQNKTGAKPRRMRPQNFRKKENADAIPALKRDLDNKLFAEYDNLNEALKSLSVSEQRQAVVLPISTRGIGLVMAKLAQRIDAQFPNLDIPIYAWYRVSLGQVQLKLNIAQEGSMLPNHRPRIAQTIMSADERATINTMRVNLAPLSNIINSIGNFSLNDINYTPAENPVNPFTPTLTTLQQYVHNAVANNNHLYSTYACIPGADWRMVNGIPVLQNPEAIIPDPYTRQNLRDDIEEVKAFYANITRKTPKFGGVVDFSPDGQPSQLISCDTTAERVVCTYDGHRYTITGEAENFYSPAPVAPVQFTIGAASLVGENVTLQPANMIQSQTAIRSLYSASRKYTLNWGDVMSAIVS